MRDVNDSGSAGTEPAYDLEEPFDFAIGECCGRFVHHDNPRRHRERFGDFDELLTPDRERRDRHVERKHHAEIVENAARPGSDRRSVDQTGARRLRTEADVCRNCQLRY